MILDISMSRKSLNQNVFSTTRWVYAPIHQTILEGERICFLAEAEESVADGSDVVQLLCPILKPESCPPLNPGANSAT